MTNGYFEVGSVRRIPIRVHWTALVVPFLMGGLWRGAKMLLVYSTIILVHELGHAFVARVRGLRVVEIALHGLGGHCRHLPGSNLDGLVVAWGGVLAQAWLGLALHAYGVGMSAGVFVFDPSVADLIGFVNRTNLGIAIFNLLPIRPLDGHDAWKLPGVLYRGVVRAPIAASIDGTTGSDRANRVAVDVVAAALEQARRDAGTSDDETESVR